MGPSQVTLYSHSACLASSPHLFVITHIHLIHMSLWCSPLIGWGPVHGVHTGAHCNFAEWGSNFERVGGMDPRPWDRIQEGLLHASSMCSWLPGGGGVGEAVRSPNPSGFQVLPHAPSDPPLPSTLCSGHPCLPSLWPVSVTFHTSGFCPSPSPEFPLQFSLPGHGAGGHPPVPSKEPHT